MQAQDFGQLIVPILVFVIYGVVSLMKNAGEQQAKAARKRPRPPQPRVPANDPGELRNDMELRPAPAQPRGQAPQAELEKLLDELGLRKPDTPRRPPPLPKPPQMQKSSRERPAKPPKLPKERTRKRQDVADRRLESTLARRHADAVHSAIENKHLESAIEGRVLKEATADAPLIGLAGGDSPMAKILADKNLLRQAFVLGLVLGPPNSVRGHEPLA